MSCIAGSGGAPPLGSESAWKSALWTRIDSLLERLYRGAIQIWNLQRVLSKKRDPLTHTRLLDAIAGSTAYTTYLSHGHHGATAGGEGADASADDPALAEASGSAVGAAWPPKRASGKLTLGTEVENVLFERFWGTVTAKVRTQLSLALSSSTFLRDALVEGFPKLRALLLSTCNRIQVRPLSCAVVGAAAGENTVLFAAEHGQPCSRRGERGWQPG